MKIGGLEKLSLIDYPGCLSAIIFTVGCNFRCHFCYNPMLVWPSKELGGIEEYKNKGFSPVPEEDLFLFLKSRVGKLDGIVITGGEPTMHHDLPEFITKIRELGFKIKLDTNGTNPETLAKLLEQKLIDYLAMDLKAPLAKYELVVGVPVDCQKLLRSVKMVIESGLPHEFRTTVTPGLLEIDDFSEMGQVIKGADAWYLQKFKSDTELVDPMLQGKKAYSSQEMEEMAIIGSKFVGICQLR
ncbi:MAG: anaerobic ribonucleoside-triphosphate reductase activating protein [Candidatus Falkowbacteria bacterium]|nr:anaerobic ribonucleoside-triphosphate reductase activating protein [Candidatus Falkowbacteria bacterium]